MRILLIRHGQTTDNVSGALGTVAPGPGLTELGGRQADAIPRALEAEAIDAVYASTLYRAQVTAAPIARSRGLTPRVVEGIQEIAAGDLEGRSDRDAIRQYIGTIFSWWVDFDARIPGGEDGNGFYDRFDRAIADIAAENSDHSTVVVVSHGAAIRAWVSWTSRNLDAEFSRTHELDNSSVVVVEGSPADGWETTYWAGEPVGGILLSDPVARDPLADADADADAETPTVGAADAAKNDESDSVATSGPRG